MSGFYGFVFNDRFFFWDAAMKGRICRHGHVKWLRLAPPSGELFNGRIISNHRMLGSCRHLKPQDCLMCHNNTQHFQYQ